MAKTIQVKRARQVNPAMTTNAGTAVAEKPEPLIEAWGIVHAEASGDLWHPVRFIIQGDRVISVERDPATLKVICAQRISECLYRPT